MSGLGNAGAVPVYPLRSSGMNNDTASSRTQERRQHAMPRSSLYLSFRRVVTADEFSSTLRRGLQREKDGVLEASPGSDVVVFLDDMHLAKGVRA